MPRGVEYRLLNWIRFVHLDNTTHSFYPEVRLSLRAPDKCGKFFMPWPEPSVRRAMLWHSSSNVPPCEEKPEAGLRFLSPPDPGRTEGAPPRPCPGRVRRVHP